MKKATFDDLTDDSMPSFTSYKNDNPRSLCWSRQEERDERKPGRSDLEVPQRKTR